MVAGAAWTGGRVGARVRSTSVATSLACLVGGSALIRFLFALQRPTITYLPDEYTYASLARGLADAGRPLIRGSVAHFPALLEPLLAAPFWLWGDPGLALRLTQAEGALAMSLAAIPVYLLAERLGSGRGLALGCAVVTLASPDLVYASYLTADAIAYPLVLSAAYVGVIALEAPNRKAQLGFLVLTGLAMFARLEYVVLVPAFLIAVAVAPGQGNRQAIRRAGLVAGPIAAACGLIAVAGPARVVGIYGSVVHLHVSAATIGAQFWTDIRLLPFSAGIVAVPGALVGLVGALTRPRSAAERAFAAFTTVLTIGLIAETVVVGAAVSSSYIERYLTCVVPLLTVAFCVHARRRGGRLALLLIAAALALEAMLVPLSGFAAAGGWTDSMLLSAVSRLEQLLGVGTGAMTASLVALTLAATAALIARRPSAGAPVVLGLTAALFVAMSAAATSWTVRDSRSVARVTLPADSRWVDAARLGKVTLVETPGADPATALEQLFWNQSLVGAVRLSGAAAIDQFTTPTLNVSSRGTLVDPAGTIGGSLLVDETRTRLVFAGGRLVGSFGHLRLLRVSGTPRLAVEVKGLMSDGWLAATGSIAVWPLGRPTRLSMRLSLPPTADPNEIVFRQGAMILAAIRIGPGQRRMLNLILSAGGRSRVEFASLRHGNWHDGVSVSAEAASPVLTPISGRRSG